MKKNRQVYIFLGIWLLVNLLQAMFTEILEDEAYYWMYSEYLDWGYFDHPPMIALLIKIGYSLIPNELGVRLLPAIMGTGTIYITWLLAGKPGNWRLFVLTIGSVALMHLHLAGFLAIPDMPMLFFAALFFLVYRKYLEEDRIKWILLLSVSIAGMFYSKYHGSLVVFFTLIGNLQILRRRSFWLIALFSMILFLPHIIWQWNHDFISLQYHLIGRNDPHYLKQFYDYLLNQLLVTGPLVGVILLYLSFTSRTKRHSFERVLKFNLIGFFAFFMLSSLKDHVEPHWTAAAFIPMILLALPRLEKKPKLRKWFRTLALISIPLILMGRLYLVTPYLPLSGHLYRMFHGKQEWAESIDRAADGRPVVFTNQYQYPSLYRFYTGNFAHSRTDLDYRPHQYDEWDFEEKLFGREVLHIINHHQPGADTLWTPRGYQLYVSPEHFCSFNRIEIEITNESLVFEPGQRAVIKLKMTNPGSRYISFDSCSHEAVLYYIHYWGNADYEYTYYATDYEFTDLKPGESKEFELRIRTPDETGKSDIAFWIGHEYLLPGINGSYRKMTIIDPETQQR